MNGAKIFGINAIVIYNNQRTAGSCLLSLCKQKHNFNTQN